MMEAEIQEQARAYLKRCLAFQGIGYLVWGIVFAAEGGVLWYNPALGGGNLGYIFLFAAYALREFVTGRVSRAAKAQGTHPQLEPLPPEAADIANRYFRIENFLNRASYFTWLGGYVLLVLLPKTGYSTVGVFLLMGGFGLSALAYLWAFVRVGLIESLILAASFCTIPCYIFFVPWRGMTSVSLMLLTFGGMQAAAGFFLFLRWWAWARTVQTVPQTQGDDNS